MKKTVAWILALALIAVATVIGTVAYLTDVDSETNVFTIGNVDIDLLEYERVDTETFDEEAKVKAFDDSEEDRNPLLPAVIENGFDYTAGDTYVGWTQIGKDGYQSDIWDPAKINNEVDKMVFVKNTGDYDAYVRLYFAFEAGNFDTPERFEDMIHLNLNKTDWNWEWIPFLATNDKNGKYFIARATYKNKLAPGAFTEISLSQIALDPTATNDDVSAFGDTYEVCVNAQAIQSAGFDDPDTALDEGFGDDIPFADLTLVTGIDLKTALHNLNGNDSDPITANVATVTFGLNEEYPNVVANYEGTFTSVEQDAAVYTYYVPNDTNSANYDVYVLADDTIYTPKNSTELFMGMSALTKVDTANVDVSRTEIMSNMFRDCSKLSSIDTSNWETSNAKNMERIFQNCSNLADIDVSNWDVSNVENLRYAFSKCTALTELNTSSWRLLEVTDMYAMFNACTNLATLDVSGWGLNKATNLAYLFYNCPALTQLDVGDWQVGNVNTMRATFYACKSLTSLDVSEWDVSKVTTFQSFLSSDSGDLEDAMMLSSIDVSKWDTGSATSMKSMFYGCRNLTYLDLSTKPEIGAWDVSNVTDMYHMFSRCSALETLNISGWDTSSLTDMDGIFHTCSSLKVIDVSDFDTQNVTYMDQVFESCLEIEQIIGLENWDTSNVTSMSEMFFHCGQYGTNGIYGGNLQVLDLSSFNTSKVTNVSKMFHSCDRLQTIYVGDGWNMSNVTASDGMFSDCSNLKGAISYNAANANDVTYANTETGYLTHIKDKSATPEA